MKIIHDIKNPVMSIRTQINSFEIDNINLNDHKSNIIEECNALDEMLANLRIEFKSRNNMEIDEKNEFVNTMKMVTSIVNTFKSLAEKGNNILKIEIEKDFPEAICMKPIMLKRIINNLISNALKHTLNGEVSVNFYKNKQTNKQLSLELLAASKSDELTLNASNMIMIHKG